MQRDRNSNPRDFRFDDISGFGFGASMFPGIFGGKDPFDDPFFSRPRGNSFGSGSFRSNSDSNLQQRGKLKAPVIRELNSDSEEDMDDARGADSSNRNPRVEHPDDQPNGN